MVKLVIVDRAGVESAVETNVGSTLMEAIRDSGFGDLLAVCGGCCSCATCHVHVDKTYLDKVPKMKPEEDELLSTSLDRDETSRLSCQLVIDDEFDGMRVIVAQED